jgi:hypothetical protein
MLIYKGHSCYVYYDFLIRIYISYLKKAVKWYYTYRISILYARVISMNFFKILVKSIGVRIITLHVV